MPRLHLPPEVIAGIAARRTPGLSDPGEQAVFEVSKTLLATGRVPQPLHETGLAALGERGMVELVGILGHDCVAALTLNTFEIAPELEDAEFAGETA